MSCRAASSATPRPRKSGWTASPPSWAIRLRSLTRSNRIDPAGCPSTSITKRPNASGSASERSISASSASRSEARPAARNGATSSCVTSERRKSTSPGPRPAVAHRGHATLTRPEPIATPARISTSPAERRAGHRLVEQHRAVGERGHRQQVGDEARAGGAVEAEHPVEDDLGERGADEPERGDRGDRLPARRRGRKPEERERREQHERGQHRGGGEHGPGREVADALARVEVRGRVGDRREDDGERARDRPPAAGRVEAGEHRDADEPHHDPGRLEARDPLLGPVVQREQDDEDRHRRVRDRRDPRVDVLLAPGDQRERQRRVREPEHDADAPDPAQLRERLAPAHLRGEVAEQQRHREEEPQLDHGRGRHVSHRHLDEEVGATPDRGEEQEQGDVAAHFARLPARRRPFRARRRRGSARARRAPRP